ncbi:hypothetical protein WJX75_002344 [Coccomyxa subellipsoidea]|uniref:Uncharacterized protein n=1 Tax=Coccomyxa subellipsoidea TaxID=248742 RepID=A0ABR2YHD7_9CHLO
MHWQSSQRIPSFAVSSHKVQPAFFKEKGATKIQGGSSAGNKAVRSLAKDLVRRSWTFSLFTRDVWYKDPLRRCKGAEKHRRLMHISESVKDAKVLVTRLRMLDKGTAIIDWRLRGQLAIFPIDIDFMSTFELDLITGRVRGHEDRWELGRCGLPARAAWLLSRALWSAQQAARDARDDGGAALSKLSASTDEDDQRNIYADPTDPTKFFQQEDTGLKDFFSLATIAALLYLVYSAYSELEKIR